MTMCRIQHSIVEKSIKITLQIEPISYETTHHMAMTTIFSMWARKWGYVTARPLKKIKRRINFLQHARYCTVKAGLVPVQDTIYLF